MINVQAVVVIFLLFAANATLHATSSHLTPRFSRSPYMSYICVTLQHYGIFSPWDRAIGVISPG